MALYKTLELWTCYRRLRFHEINAPESLKFALILLSVITTATSIKCSVYFRALNFQHFNPNFGTCPDLLDTQLKTLTTSFLSFRLPFISVHLSQKLRRRFTIFRLHHLFIVVAVRSDVKIFTCVLIASISFIVNSTSSFVLIFFIRKWFPIKFELI